MRYASILVLTVTLAACAALIRACTRSLQEVH